MRFRVPVLFPGLTAELPLPEDGGELHQRHPPRRCHISCCDPRIPGAATRAAARPSAHRPLPGGAGRAVLSKPELPAAAAAGRPGPLLPAAKPQWRPPADRRRRRAGQAVSLS